jgi:hypothetical protein
VRNQQAAKQQAKAAVNRWMFVPEKAASQKEIEKERIRMMHRKHLQAGKQTNLMHNIMNRGCNWYIQYRIDIDTSCNLSTRLGTLMTQQRAVVDWAFLVPGLFCFLLKSQTILKK